MRLWKKYVAYIVGLLLILWSIQKLLDCLYTARANDKISALMKHQIDANVMVFGSSVAFVHFSPKTIEKRTNMSVYNMGWDGMFFAQYNGLIQEYLGYQRNCKYIVISAYVENLGIMEHIASPSLFYAYIDNDNVYRALRHIEPIPITRARYLPGYKLTMLNWNFYSKIAFSARNVASYNGFLARNLPWQPIDKATEKGIEYDTTEYGSLRQTIDQITTTGIKVVLVFPPIYHLADNNTLKNVRDDAKLYQKLVNKDVYFLDYTNDPLCTHREFFYNYTHLNGLGAEKFSLKFAEALDCINRNDSNALQRLFLER